MHRSLFTKGYKYLFAVLAPANLYLDVAIDLAVEKNGGKPVKVAMAFEQDAFSQDVRLGILYFSVTGAIAFVKPELYGPSIYLTPSCLINLSAN